MNRTDLSRSTFQDRPAYRYIRKADKLPEYGSLTGESLYEIVCPVRLFNPTGVGTWWIAATDTSSADDASIVWGVADLGHGPEVGAFSMRELEALRGRFGLPIERDLHYTSKTITAILGGETW